MDVIIRQAGLLTTVQDGGRYGYQQYGVMVSGAMDQKSMRLANLLVGNEPDEAVLEMTALGADLEFQTDCIVAAVGADMQPVIGKMPVEMGVAILVRKGETIRFQAAKHGCRTYLSFAGCLDLPEVMGSRSTLLRAGLGGYKGRKLRPGDELSLRAPVGSLPHWEKRRIEPRQMPEKLLTLRVVLGPQDDRFPAQAMETFLSSVYTVKAESDRMGYRLDGPKLAHVNGANIITDGIAFGAIQVPNDGKPIIMMADRQCTGGYTKIASVITADLPLLAQCGAGAKVQFQSICIEQAQELLHAAREGEQAFARQLQSEDPAATGSIVARMEYPYQIQVEQEGAG